MLSEYSKKSVAGNIFSDCLDGFKSISAKHIEGSNFTAWEDFIRYAQSDFEFVLDKCKFVYESFPVLHNEPHYVKLYERLNNWTPQQIFQLYGQPKELPNWFFFKEFRFQTKIEAEKSNQLAMDILNELLEEENS